MLLIGYALLRLASCPCRGDAEAGSQVATDDGAVRPGVGGEAWHANGFARALARPQSAGISKPGIAHLGGDQKRQSWT